TRWTFCCRRRTGRCRTRGGWSGPSGCRCVVCVLRCFGQAFLSPLRICSGKAASLLPAALLPLAGSSVGVETHSSLFAGVCPTHLTEFFLSSFTSAERGATCRVTALPSAPLTTYHTLWCTCSFPPLCLNRSSRPAYLGTTEQDLANLRATRKGFNSALRTALQRSGKPSGAQTRMAHGPDGTRGFPPGWRSVPSLYAGKNRGGGGCGGAGEGGGGSSGGGDDAADGNGDKP
ncbi:unnamed protein product, partial [Phaeothamnion confervicola]